MIEFWIFNKSTFILQYVLDGSIVLGYSLYYYWLLLAI